MRDDERTRWNERYREETALAAPSPFLSSLDMWLPRHGRALDVAGGSGRHALWLARRGLDVTLVDISDVALERATRAAAAERLAITTLRADLTRDPLPPGPWDLIVCIAFLHRPLFEAFPRALAPGGLLVFEHPTRSNLLRFSRPGPRHLLDDGELRGLVVGLEVLRYDEGWLDRGRHDARLVARRAAAEP